ncbi:MAG: heparinase II/III family protein [Flavobacteriaceae bacterium]
MRRISLILLSFLLCSFGLIAQNNNAHPRIYITNKKKEAFFKTIENVKWKKELVDKKKKNLEKYLNYCKEDPTWLVSRLQMNWKTKHDKVFLRSGNFSYSEGEAPVPTVRYSGTRDWATDYRPPSLEGVQPYFDDPRGMYLEHKKTGEKEWIHPSKSGHIIEGINRKIMSLVEDAAFLYWLTGDEKYAEFAAPVYLKYIEGMYYREAPLDLDNSGQQRLSGLATFEVIHEKILIHLTTTYDFLFGYFKKKKIDLDHSTAVFQKWGDQIIKNGVPDNNWNLFQARFLTYVALVMDSNDAYENGKGREYFLKYTFNTTTERQLSINESLLVYDQESGIWPESASYSTHVITTLLNILTLLDNSTNANELSNYPIIEKAALASFQYLFPTGYTVGFGDSNHKMLPPENFELLISNYKKYGNTEKETLISNLLGQMIKSKHYTRKAKDLFKLFFYADEIKTGNDQTIGLEKLTSPTFYAPNVSMFIQRMGEKENAAMVATTGSFGNHSHANGISMELFANGYVLGAEMGKGSSYWHPDHREFYSRFAAHNTVIVDGISDYDAMRGYHPYTLDNSFPNSKSVSHFDKVTFSKVSFLEPKTVADQQRFTAIVKSTIGQPYILDIFRSRKQRRGKQKHEYFYHNLGQSLEFKNNQGAPLNLIPTDELGSHKGDAKGYDYFTDKEKVITSENVQALFRIKEPGKPDNLMKVWIKGSEKQHIYSILGPKSNAVSKGTAPEILLKEPVPAFVLKRETESWENPFAVVFNPIIEGKENPIAHASFSSVENYPNAQIIQVELNDKKTVDQIVVNTSESDVVEHNEIYQKGVVSILRRPKESNEIDFLFLSGMEKFEYQNWSVITSAEAATVSIERTKDGYLIENSVPVTIGIPVRKEKKLAELQLFKNGKLVATRKATLKRGNPEQMTIKLSEPYQNAILLTNE